MTTAPTPVYSGKVVTLYCVDRITERTYPRTVPDDPDKIKAARERAERAGDKVLRVGDPRDAMPGEIPQSTAKSIQQERAEKAAAKLASVNQQRGTKREAVKAKRTAKAVVVAPKVEKTAKPAPQPTLVAAPKPKTRKRKPTKRAYVRKAPAPTAVAVVCLSTGKYYPTLSKAQSSVPVGANNRSLAQSLTQKGGITRYRGKIYAYATDEEKAACACLRSAKDVHLPRLVSGSPAMSKPLILVDTGTVYRTVGDLIAAVHLSRRRFIRIQPGEVRQTPAGAVRHATHKEVQQWKQAQGGQMAIAFNQNR